MKAAKKFYVHMYCSFETMTTEELLQQQILASLRSPHMPKGVVAVIAQFAEAPIELHTESGKKDLETTGNGETDEDSADANTVH